MKRLFLALLLLSSAHASPPLAVKHLRWTFEPGYTDAVEYQRVGGGIWQQLDGPYALTPDGREYAVPLSLQDGGRLFRIRRVFGAPWILPLTGRRAVRY
jgi:hypothetical protein